MHGGDHGLAGDLGITVSDSDCGFLVQAEQHLRLGIAEVIDDAVVQPAIARARRERDVGNIQRAQRVGDHVAAKTRRVDAGGGRPFDLRHGGVGVIGFGACGRRVGRRHDGSPLGACPARAAELPG